MTGPAFALFGTPIGTCGIVWKGGAVVATALPDTSRGALALKLQRRFPDAAEAAMPPAIAALAEAIIALLGPSATEPDPSLLDFSGVDSFERRVYDAALAIPRGETRTYGELAAAIGSPGAARAVGRALGRNPFPIIIPCHRILAASGGSGGFSAPGGALTKMRLLDIERAASGAAPGLFDMLPWQVKP
ncbi:methylated-DNA--[protein]-cysteine S-methyltransferase [Allosphingosinicella vermicomposti]|uniref:methylated-DNA--[protein]-cysteine S-methyltransferase n=1 Tax=Allosphingosinicella vermicomposti TaxID=614671 RepID=UPI000D0FA76C|nr:MGMT family protein [Allosphingosinicella vermicomposti]